MIANLGNVRSNKVGGPLIMNLKMLNSFINALNPKKIIPVHIDDFSHYETSIEEIKQAKIELFPQGKWLDI